jgi:hypothetical protein
MKSKSSNGRNKAASFARNLAVIQQYVMVFGDALGSVTYYSPNPKPRPSSLDLADGGNRMEDMLTGTTLPASRTCGLRLNIKINMASPVRPALERTSLVKDVETMRLVTKINSREALGVETQVLRLEEPKAGPSPAPTRRLPGGLRRPPLDDQTGTLD